MARPRALALGRATGDGVSRSVEARHLVELYGLAVSSPVPLPGRPLAASTPVDVTVHFAAAPAGTADPDASGDGERIHTSETVDGGEPSLVVDRFDRARYLRLTYAEGIRFHIGFDGQDVWSDWTAPLTVADAVTFLLGPVMGVVLRHRRVPSLHASAVILEGRAWGFVGPGGAGKSTLAAAFAAQGDAMLTEDVLALRPEAGHAGWLAAPAYAEIRLWDEGASLVRADAATLPALSPTWPKRGLDLARHRLPFATGPAPLGGLFILDEVRPDAVEPQCARVGASAGLIDLVANAYVNYLASTKSLAYELQELAEVARAVPLWQLRAGAGQEGLARTLDRVRSVAHHDVRRRLTAARD